MGTRTIIVLLAVILFIVGWTMAWPLNVIPWFGMWMALAVLWRMRHA